MAMLMMVVSAKANKAIVTDITFACCDIYIYVCTDSSTQERITPSYNNGTFSEDHRTIRKIK